MVVLPERAVAPPIRANGPGLHLYSPESLVVTSKLFSSEFLHGLAAALWR